MERSTLKASIVCHLSGTRRFCHTCSARFVFIRLISFGVTKLIYLNISAVSVDACSNTNCLTATSYDRWIKCLIILINFYSLTVLSWLPMKTTLWCR